MPIRRSPSPRPVAPSVPDVACLRRDAAARSLFAAGPLAGALTRLGFVQADPIRAPARAQDLTLRHRVADYRAGDLERRYPELGVDEDFFINYGFLPAAIAGLMHPRARLGGWPSPGKRRADAVLAFVRERGEVHPRDVDAHFKHGSVTNYWGGSSSATTHLLDHLHYRGLLRVTRRESGIRLYAPRPAHATAASTAERRQRFDALIDVLMAQYAPVPAATLTWWCRRLRLAVPQWPAEAGTLLARSRRRLAGARIEGVEWFWPDGEPSTAAPEPADAVRLLAPFDPVVWDRTRFELLWGWAYRFEAYTPLAKRRFGYYALPLLWRDRVIGWANVSVRDGVMDVAPGFVSGRAPREAAFRRAFDAEVAALRTFLG